MITTYQPGFSEPRKIIENNWYLLNTSVATKPWTNTEKRVIHGYRRPKNLRDLLVKAKTDYHPDQITTNQSNNNLYPPKNRCTTRLCRYCPKLDKSGRITSTHTKREYVAKHNVSCKSNNIVYCITCLQCGKQYVGETKRRLMDRFQEHFRSVTKNTPGNDIAYHFNQPDHHGLDDMKLHILDFIYLNPHSQEGL